MLLALGEVPSTLAWGKLLALGGECFGRSTLFSWEI